MEYRALGTTGIEVSTFALGTASFGDAVGPDRDVCVSMVRRALDHGITMIDAADSYGPGTAEEIVGTALRGRRQDVVVCTKVGLPTSGTPGGSGTSRRWIMESVEGSLRRLGTEWIDVYMIHRPDPATDLEETLGAMTDLVRSGKVRAVGCSTFPAHQLVEAHWISQELGLEQLTVEQPPYSILVRHGERDVFEVTQRFGMGVVVWAPLASGYLTGKYRGGAAPVGSRAARLGRSADVATRFKYDVRAEHNAPKHAAVDRLATIAATAGIPLAQLAHAWVLHHPAVTSAIIGPRLPEQLDDALRGADLRLGADVLDAIDEVVPPGTTVVDADRSWVPPGLAREARRR